MLSKRYKAIFLPQHCVIKTDSSITKLRVVFDGSDKTSSGFPLNDIRMCGPTIKENLFNILLGFRTLKYTVTRDVCKIYSSVKMLFLENFLQCILWRNKSGGVLQIHKLDTVTYGTKLASFSSIRPMHQLAYDEKSNFSIGSQTVVHDFYVDELISGGKLISDVGERETRESSFSWRSVNFNNIA